MNRSKRLVRNMQRSFNERGYEMTLGHVYEALAKGLMSQSWDHYVVDSNKTKVTFEKFLEELAQFEEFLIKNFERKETRYGRVTNNV